MMSSQFEGFGMVLAKAIACDVPGISFDPYSPSDINKNSEDSFWVANANVGQLSQKICHLIIMTTNEVEWVPKQKRTSKDIPVKQSWRNGQNYLTNYSVSNKIILL